jgi:hypothetical protein
MALQTSPPAASAPVAPAGPFSSYRDVTRRNLRIQEGLRAILLGEEAHDPERGEREPT